MKIKTNGIYIMTRKEHHLDTFSLPKLDHCTCGIWSKWEFKHKDRDGGPLTTTNLKDAGSLCPNTFGPHGYTKIGAYACVGDGPNYMLVLGQKRRELEESALT